MTAILLLAVTKVMFFFDTEDFTCDESSDAIRETANILTAEAVTRMLRGEKAVPPGRVHGFLERPRGVKAPVTVRTDDLRRAAAKLDLAEFIPAEIEVGDAKIGPADFLMAGLEALTTGAGSVTVKPREQLGSFANCPSLATVDIKGGWCIHSPDLNGALLDERLKLQLWTLRFEPIEI